MLSLYNSDAGGGGGGSGHKKALSSPAGRRSRWLGGPSTDQVVLWVRFPVGAGSTKGHHLVTP